MKFNTVKLDCGKWGCGGNEYYNVGNEYYNTK